MVYQPSFISVNLATVCLESLLYGIFLTLYVSSTFLLLSQGHRKLVAAGAASYSILRAPMFIAAHVIFCTVTGHWICTVLRLFDAFVNYQGGSNPLYIYANLALPSEVVKSALLVGTLATSDAMIVLNAKHRFTVFTGAGVAWQFSLYTFSEDVWTSLAGRWITIFISWKVWRTTVRTKSYGGGNILGALAIIVESAFISTAWNLVFLITYQTHNNVQFTAIDLWSSISGIAFMLINLRVSLGWAQQAILSSHSASYSGGGAVLTAPHSPRPFSYQSRFSQLPSPGGRGDPFAPQYPLRVLTVNVTQVVDRVRDSTPASAASEKYMVGDDGYGEAV
ncbi:predicted protein [Postia placenta Mad-698-R]|nr:predicted protein [Postia placenta Mad-698-R]